MVVPAALRPLAGRLFLRSAYQPAARNVFAPAVLRSTTNALTVGRFQFGSSASDKAKALRVKERERALKQKMREKAQRAKDRKKAELRKRVEAAKQVADKKKLAAKLKDAEKAKQKRKLKKAVAKKLAAAKLKAAAKQKKMRQAKAAKKKQAPKPAFADPQKPKMPMSGYIRYVEAARAVILTNKPNIDAKGIVSHAAEGWRKLTPEIKNQWKDSARDDMAAYWGQMATYRKSGRPQQWLGMTQGLKLMAPSAYNIFVKEALQNKKGGQLKQASAQWKSLGPAEKKAYAGKAAAAKQAHRAQLKAVGIERSA